VKLPYGKESLAYDTIIPYLSRFSNAEHVDSAVLAFLTTINRLTMNDASPVRYKHPMANPYNRHIDTVSMHHDRFTNCCLFDRLEYDCMNVTQMQATLKIIQRHASFILNVISCAFCDPIRDKLTFLHISFVKSIKTY